MKVIFVGAGAGDPELLTVKAQRLLNNAKLCVYAGSLVNPGIIDLLPANAEKINSANLNLDELIEIFKKAQEQNVDVIRLHSGDPSIYGAIGEQMTRLDQLGVEYEVVPGISSFQAAAAALKTELTAPEVSQTIILTRTGGRTPVPETQRLKSLARTRATLCIFLSTHKIAEVAQILSEDYGADCPVAVVYRASWPDQVIFRGVLADIAQKVKTAGINKTAMIVVGTALKQTGIASKLYDAAFTHEFREGTQL